MLSVLFRAILDGPGAEDRATVGTDPSAAARAEDQGRAVRQVRPSSVCRACLTVWRCKSSPNLMEVKGSEVQGRRREASSKGSTEQNRDLTYRNRIGGHTDRANWQRTAKPISIKGPWGKFGRCAGKTVRLTSGDLHRVRDSGLRKPRGSPDRGAEVSRGRSRCEQSARSIETLTRKGRNGQGSQGRKRHAEGPNGSPARE